MNHLRGERRLSGRPRHNRYDAAECMRWSARYWAKASRDRIHDARRMVDVSPHESALHLTAAAEWWGLALSYWRYARLALRGDLDAALEREYQPTASDLRFFERHRAACVERVRRDAEEYERRGSL